MFIRRAHKKDIPTLLDLLAQVLLLHVNIRTDLFSENTTKYREEELLKMIEDDNNLIYVVEKDEVVVAYAFSMIRKSKVPHLFKRKKSFYIDDFCVDNKYHRQHIGEALFDFLKAEAKRLECEDMTLNCYVDNIVAKKFYEKMGFKDRSSIMEYVINK